MESNQDIRNSPYYGLLVKLLKQYQEKPESRVFAALADTYRKCGLFEEAEKIYETGIAQHPSYVAAAVGFARCLFEIKNYVKAIEVLERKFNQIQENVRALEILATSYEQIGNYKKALQIFQHVYDLIPFEQRYKENVKRLAELCNVTEPPAQDANELSLEKFNRDLRSWSYSQIVTDKAEKSPTISKSYTETHKEEALGQAPPIKPKENKSEIPGSPQEKKIQFLQNLLEKINQQNQQ